MKNKDNIGLKNKKNKQNVENKDNKGMENKKQE